MNQLTTQAIILSRTDYGEADRIVTLLTPHSGKIRLVAKGVKRMKSKLAGGIELFSVSTITYIKGRGELGTLISSRLETHYGHIVEDIGRTMAGYELIKKLNKVTEDQPETDYFVLLHKTFALLDDSSIPLAVVQWWFQVQLLRFDGHSPNLQVDTAGDKLTAGQTYNFDYTEMAFFPSQNGAFTSDHIKLLRLAFAGHSAPNLAQIKGAEGLLPEVVRLTQTMLNVYI